jgi:hypothetical protein
MPFSNNVKRKQKPAANKNLSVQMEILWIRKLIPEQRNKPAGEGVPSRPASHYRSC